jgi:predicted ArsR family transcriptional regulator
LVKRLQARLSPEDLEELMHEVGRSLGPVHPSNGTLKQRVENGSQLLQDLGGLTSVIEEDGRFTILGQGCPLSLATVHVPQACSIITSLLRQVIGQPVSNCCERYDRKRCCFEVAALGAA